MSRPTRLLLAAAALTVAVLLPGAPLPASPAAAPAAGSAAPAAHAASPASAASPAGTPPPPDTASEPPPVPAPPDAAEAARLATGEVLLSSRPFGSRQLSEEIGRGIIDAPPQRVFAAVTDFAHYDEWVPFVKKSDAHPQADGSVLSFESLDLPFPLGTRYYRFRARKAVEERPGAESWRVWWTYVPGSGNVADHHGWWVLVPSPGGKTLGTCLLFTDPGGSTPAWALHRGTAETMPYIFSALRQQILRGRYDHP